LLLRLGQPHPGLENYPLKSKIFQIFHHHFKLIYSGRVKKYQDHRQVGHLFTPGQKYAQVWSCQGPSLAETVEIMASKANQQPLLDKEVLRKGMNFW